MGARPAGFAVWATLLLGLSLGGSGCARRVPEGAATTTGGGLFAHPWSATVEADHPWVGRIWSVAEGRWVDEAALLARVGQAPLVLLGETHDNPDHHLLQAKLVRAMTSDGRRPAVAFEMIDSPRQPQLDQARSPEEVAAAVEWSKSGWPDFSLYRPIFEVATSSGLPLVAANLPRETAKALVMKGPEVLPPEERARLEAKVLSPEAEQRLRAQLFASHCGHLPESMVGGFLLAQRARDAHLAARLLAGRTRDGAALIAGAGHVRRDYGVPAALAGEVPPEQVLSVALMEVPAPSGGGAAAEGSASGAHPDPARVAAFDFVVFTPAFARKDPCLGMKLPSHAPKPHRE